MLNAVNSFERREYRITFFIKIWIIGHFDFMSFMEILNLIKLIFDIGWEREEGGREREKIDGSRSVRRFLIWRHAYFGEIYYWKKKFCARRSCDAVEKIDRGGKRERARTVQTQLHSRRSVYRVRAPEKHVSFVYRKLVARAYSEIFDIITSNYLSIDGRSWY